MGAMETERKRELSGGGEQSRRTRRKREKSARDNDGGGEKRVICSNSTFPPLIFLHNRTVKSMWSSATSCSAASRSLFFSPSIHPSISSLSLLSHFPPLSLLQSFIFLISVALCPSFNFDISALASLPSLMPVPAYFLSFVLSIYYLYCFLLSLH